MVQNVFSLVSPVLIRYDMESRVSPYHLRHSCILRLQHHVPQHGTKNPITVSQLDKYFRSSGHGCLRTKIDVRSA
jgi:hypothetical protein